MIENKIFKNNKSKYFKIVAAILVFAFIIYVAYDKLANIGTIDYRKYNKRVVLTVDGEEVTFSDMAYYFLRRERDVEEEAIVYNPSSPKDYWNTRNKGVILSAKIKKDTLDMVIHDTIMYNLSKKAKVKLNLREQTFFYNERADFWDDLFDAQLENLYTTRAVVNITMKKTAISEKYQRTLAKKMGISYERLSYGGDKYKKMLQDHHVKVNKRLWQRVVLGEVTLRHHTVNFVQ